MPTDLTLFCPGVRGTVAKAFEALIRAGVEVTGYAGFGGVLHVLVDDPNRAREAAEAAGVEVRGEQEIMVVPVEDRPAALADVLRRIADAEVGLNLLYTTTDGHTVIGSSNLDSARTAALD